MHTVSRLIDRLEATLRAADQCPCPGSVTYDVFSDILTSFGASPEHIRRLGCRFALRLIDAHAAERCCGTLPINYCAVTAWLRAQTPAVGQRACIPDMANTSDLDEEAPTPVQPARSVSRVPSSQSFRSQGLQASWLAAALARARSSTSRSRSVASSHEPCAVLDDKDRSVERDSNSKRLCDEEPSTLPTADADAFYADVDRSRRIVLADRTEAFSTGSSPHPTRARVSWPNASLRRLFESLDVADEGWLSLAHLTHSMRRRGVEVSFHDLVRATDAATASNPTQPTPTPMDTQRVGERSRSATAHTRVSAVDFALLCAHLPPAVIEQIHQLAATFPKTVHRHPSPPSVRASTSVSQEAVRQEQIEASEKDDGPARAGPPVLRGAPSSPLPSPPSAANSTWMDVSLSPKTPTPRQASRSPSFDSVGPSSTRASSPAPRCPLHERLRMLDRDCDDHYTRSAALAVPAPSRQRVSLRRGASLATAAPARCFTRRSSSDVVWASSCRASRGRSTSGSQGLSPSVSRSRSATSLPPNPARWSPSAPLQVADRRICAHTRVTPGTRPERGARSDADSVAAVPIFHMTLRDDVGSDAAQGSCARVSAPENSGLCLWRKCAVRRPA